MWNDLDKPMQEAFTLAWESYTKGTVPIGAVVVDSTGNILARGRNRIFDGTSSNPLAGTSMGHAEMTAMMQLKEKEHPDINSYCLYTTMEPCPMCFGTMVMVRIRNLYYAARDGFAGAAGLNDKMDYIKSKNIKITAGNQEIEAFQIILQTSYECKRQHKRMQDLFDSWSEYCLNGVRLGKELYQEGYFDDALITCKDISKIYDEIINRYNSRDKEGIETFVI